MATSLTKTGPNYDPNLIDFAKEGAVFVAPVGTVEPAGMTAYADPFEDVGWLSTDGIEEAIDEERGDVEAWQAAGKVKQWTKSKTFEFSFTMLARSLTTVSVFYGIPKDQFELVEGTGGSPSYYEWVDGGAPDLDERFFALDYISGSGKSHDRILIPNGSFSDRGSITLNRDDTIRLSGKVTANITAQGWSIKRRSTGLVLPTP
ncbi:hypothetical protein M3G04_02330 [Dietzia cinnamea]|uniref:phage tail tube protein n=1 Tax=Dietzia cinnamea TaxID=321318 RepID=UPI00223B1507|nr:hypothetical protein [Dietzia cinnamea]MCT2299747.1 hypothetical protein [Dietzia cinnamea]